VEPIKIVNILAEVSKPPYETLSQVLEGKYSFAIGAHPSEVRNNDDPPVQIEKNQDIIPIDSVLGLYDPEDRCITIYQKGIRNIAHILSAKEIDLELIVRLHEWAHAMLHVGLTQEESLRFAKGQFEDLETFFDVRSHDFKSIDEYVHEVMAQLLTRMAIGQMRRDARNKASLQILERIMVTFIELMRRQPKKYDIHDYEDVPYSRVTKAFDLLRRNILPGKKDLFHTVMRW